MTKHFDANDIIRTVKMAKEKPKEKKPRKWYRPEISGERIDQVHGARRIKHWLVKFIWRF